MNPFEKLGMKEVADVQFIALQTDADAGITAGDVVLFLDTLKVSTIDITAEEAEARGGKGNPALISWDFGKEIAVSLDDAVMSMASLSLMTGSAVREADTTPNEVKVHKTALLKDGDSVPAGITAYQWISPGKGTRGADSLPAALAADYPVRIFYEDLADGTAKKGAYEITINAENFPGTYKIVGDTVVRDTNNQDHPFQFVIPKAKVGAEISFAMETDGDPAVFSMGLKVLRDDNGDMLKLIRYDMV